jgi:hypothetical protein
MSIQVGTAKLSRARRETEQQRLNTTQGGALPEGPS